MAVVEEQTLQIVQSYITQISEKLASLDATTAFLLYFLNHAFIVSNVVHERFSQLKATNLIKEIPFLVGLLCVFATGLGGSIINSLIQGKPQLFLSNDNMIVLFMSTWILTLYFPFGLIRFITTFPLIEVFSYAVEGLFVGNIVIGAVNSAAKEYPDSMFAPILIGTLSACGGAILRPFFTNQYVGQPVESTVLSQPTLGIKIPMLAAIFYYVSTQVIDFEPFNYTIQQGKVSLVVQFTPELIVQTCFIALWLFYFSNRFSAKFFTRSSPAAKKIDVKGISSTTVAPAPTKTAPAATKKNPKSKTA